MSISAAPHLFAIVPIEACADPRLTPTELRVLIALFSFRNKATHLCCPKRDAIAERTGLSCLQISKATTGLAEKGWLEKSGKGGAGKASHYVITVPELERFQIENGSEISNKTVPKQAPPLRTDKVTEISPSFHSGESAHAKRRPDVNPTENANLRRDGPHSRATGRARESQRATRMSEEFELPADWRQWALQERPGMEVERTFATFRDHWLANGKPMRDWFACWRNWVRREAQFERRGYARSSRRGDYDAYAGIEFPDFDTAVIPG